MQPSHNNIFLNPQQSRLGQLQNFFYNLSSKNPGNHGNHGNSLPKKKSKNKPGKRHSGYNTDFSAEKAKVKDELQKDFKMILKDYEIVEMLGKGSYGIVIKVKK